MEKPVDNTLTPGPAPSGKGENRTTLSRPLVILYSANLRGDLELLPRLYTFIRQLKQQPADLENDVMICMVEPAHYRTLLLDLGNSCAPGVWHCGATGGRSTLIVLDAMGYDAANVSGFLTAEGRAKLEGNVSVGLVDAAHTWQDGDVLITNGSLRGDRPGRPYSIHIALTTATSTHLDGNTLYLAPVNAGQLGMAQVTSAGSKLTLAAHEVFDLPATTPPDPTIAATVEFVVSEARLFERKKG
jgi:hypothetical protein